MGRYLINICNPNNPTGTIVDKEALSSWILNAPSNHLFLIDEAYHEYAVLNPLLRKCITAYTSWERKFGSNPHIFKIYGMAGMRVGYGIAAKNTGTKTQSFSNKLEYVCARGGVCNGFIARYGVF